MYYFRFNIINYGGCFMNLTQLETNFRSCYEDLKLKINQAQPWSIAKNGPLNVKAMRFNDALDQFEAQKASIIWDLQMWKNSISKNQKSDPSKDPHHDLMEINRKNKTRKTCIKILNFVGGIFCGTGFMSMFGAHALLRFKVITATAALGPTFGGLAICALGGIILGVSALVKDSKLSREVRLYNSENFKDFLRDVAKVNPDEKNLQGQKLDLLNPTLHKIYERYKAAVTLLPHE